MASIVKSIPNFLTYLRLFLVPVLVALLIDPTPESVHWAAFFFIIASVTDFFDGFIARRFCFAGSFWVDLLLFIGGLLCFSS